MTNKKTKLMKPYSLFLEQYMKRLGPIDEVEGYKVRPGFF